MKRCSYILILVYLFIFLNFNLFVMFFFTFYTSIIKWFLSLFSFSMSLGDLNSRILLDFFFINNFFFLWTNLWYITFYFIIFNLIIFFFKNHFIQSQIFFFFMFFFFFNGIIYLDFYNYNFYIINYYSFPFKENSLLVNAVNKIHPLMLHLSFNLFFSYFFIKNTSFSHVISFQTFNINKFFKTYLIIIIFTLYLGSWWALQEGSWGGWWNWDVSEVFGLFILFRIFLLFHSKIYLTFLKIYEFYNFNSIIFFAYFYSLMQINFTLVSHNFGFRNLKSLNPELSFLLLTVFLIFLWLIVIHKLRNYISFFIVKPRITTQSYILYLLLLSIPFYISFFMLIQNFLWNILEFKVVNIKFNYKNYLIILIIMFMTPFIKVSFRLYIIFISFYNNYMYIFIILNVFTKLNIWRYLSHLFILYGVYLSVIHSSNIIDVWISIFNYDYFDELFQYSINSAKIESSYNFMKYGTSLESKTFALLIKNNILSQNYYPAGDIKSYVILIYDNLSLTLSMLFLCILITLWALFFYKKFF